MEQVTKCHRHTEIIAGSSVSIRRLEDFPTDAIFNILLSLPVKSLMCCRCVCKTWRSIIDSPSFINMHFTTTEEHQLMLVSYATRRQDKLRLFTLMDAGVEVLRSSEFPIVEIANSCDYTAESVCYSLFCFRNMYNARQVFLLNPLRGEVLMLPPATVTTHPDFYGVGFDCTTKTYKVVHFFRPKPYLFNLKQHDFAAEVYTLGTRSWREIPTVPPYYLEERTVSAYGDVHCCGCKWFPDGSKEFVIMSFDPRKEEINFTPHPNRPNLPRKLFDFRGHLAMVDDSSRTHIEVWVLKDYEKKDWAIEYRIRTELLLGQTNLNLGYRIMMLAGVGAWQDGLLFQEGCDSLAYYDPKTDSVKFTCIPESIVPSCDEILFGCTQIFSYTKSLVSLKNSGNIIAREAGLRNCFDLSTSG